MLGTRSRIPLCYAEQPRSRGSGRSNPARTPVLAEWLAGLVPCQEGLCRSRHRPSSAYGLVAADAYLFGGREDFNRGLRMNNPSSIPVTATVPESK
jgi:hypothetical protein